MYIVYIVHVHVHEERADFRWLQNGWIAEETLFWSKHFTCTCTVLQSSDPTLYLLYLQTLYHNYSDLCVNYVIRNIQTYSDPLYYIMYISRPCIRTIRKSLYKRVRVKLLLVVSLVLKMLFFWLI